MEITQMHADILAKAYQIGTTGYVDDWEDNNFDDDDTFLDTTRDELDRYRKGNHSWNESRGYETFIVDGYNVVFWEMAQATKGQRRESLTVVDFGDFRGICQL